MGKMAKSGKKTVFCKSRDGSITYTTDGSFLYAEKDGTSMRLDLFDRHYYKLRIFNDVPILEIDGLRMQLVKDFKNPLEYSKEVVKRLKLQDKDAVVLDSCMGLGYTAIEASKKAKLVITIEKSEAVYNLAKWNPFSEELWDKNGNIMPLLGDASEVIRTFDDSMFNYVIHDPPRFSHAPELYSDEFYKELCRVCKKNARIFHYVGSVGKKKGRNIEKEVSGRLAVAGFKEIKYAPRLQGIFCVKK